MSKRAAQYRIRSYVSGSFVGLLGRIAYELEPGTVSEKDVDPEVLARLIAAGRAVKASKTAESEESA